ncbi:uncharacterized protein LACBIDRAFT_310124 [Laccaria bicolor S238N-H82]|uniref:Predicted protein n=1 Tax=Laccaria bicolor (strain S238N-H82 / ATCC MYA-4686) TaxID=486041 RepID=B0D6N7_LACBS|nr:uncharacterized protein LACBIDRAFT_318642 [Laccaria bicolor S238N-H82]XP_001887306.1 uncharacterized protein LACBIDRAFT_310124 [Laccaria bicolor S238N-H82]EDR01915.1 predicted protein [Laccaria bicolor S238N-H82]EDR09507.1 predicted protein [Laccaria bicolor S238N-H82]|eukprot:XP_001879856.1 predicted protein [Laccaria bicolor S238N-H82]
MQPNVEVINLPTGVSLETILSKPPPTTHSEGTKLAICLHPWSWLGGRMQDPVLDSLVDPLLSKNYHVLRYNSRGVGRSTGRASFTGFDEAKDLEAIIRWTLDHLSNVSSVVIIGYSHGSLIASLQPPLPAPVQTSHVLLSYPLGPRSWLTLFRSSTYAQRLEDLIKSSTSRVLVVFGDQDEFTSISSYRTWVAELETHSGTSDRLNIVEVGNATHFWRGHANERLKHVLLEWLQ